MHSRSLETSAVVVVQRKRRTPHLRLCDRAEPVAADTAAAPVGPVAAPSPVEEATAAATAALVGRLVRGRFLLFPLAGSRLDTAPSKPGFCTFDTHVCREILALPD